MFGSTQLVEHVLESGDHLAAHLLHDVVFLDHVAGTCVVTHEDGGVEDLEGVFSEAAHMDTERHD